MTALGFLVLLVIGALCGALAQLLVGYSAGGFFTSAALGIVGAFIGRWIAAVLHLPSIFVVSVEGVPIEVVWSVVGASLLLGLVALFRRRTTYVRSSYI
jgi:uncharacterized membrane protein YeaQ/YmgE (transglycosylase-associated protein family)